MFSPCSLQALHVDRAALSSAATHLHLICHVTTYDLPRKVLFAPFLFSTSVPSTILRRRFNLFLTTCYWASHTDIDLSSF